MAELQQARIFLSYARKDVVEVNKIYDRLKRYGFSPWQDHKDLIGGMEWMDEIIETINNCAFFIACISKNTVDRQTGVLVREINEALEVAKFRRKGSIFIIPVRLEKDVDFPKEFSKYHGIDLFEPEGLEKLIKALRHGIKKLGLVIRPLRSNPLVNLSMEGAKNMLRQLDFYDKMKYWTGKGLQHFYEVKDKVIIDHTTSLMWQQAGSDNYMTSDKAQEYINQLNLDKFAGFNDWRLPTLEEAMSLMEAKQNDDNGFYINSLFGKEQEWIWTADLHNADYTWCVTFIGGGCSAGGFGTNCHVRAVRSGH